MTRGVFYLLTGVGHAARLVVSLQSLRRHHAGPITVYSTQPDSHELVDRLACDDRLRIDHLRVDAVRTRKNSAFLTKVALLPAAPYDVSLYLDADTLVVGDVRPLLDAAEAGEFAATQFARWSTAKGVIRRRIQRWLGIAQNAVPPELFRERITAALRPFPAVNGGVFACRRGAGVLAPWLEWAMAGRDTFICDEVALQILLPHHTHAVLDCRFNCSPIHAAGTADVRIWHFHGEKHLRREARSIWLPAYRDCADENIAGIRDWGAATDKHLARLLQPTGNAP